MIYLIYFTLLVIVLIILPVFINLIIDKGQIENLKYDLKYIFGVVFEITKIFTIIFLVNIILHGESPSVNDIKIMIFNILYFSIFFFLIIFINFFSTRYLKFRICMRIFLDELKRFTKDNFILNLLFFTLLIFVSKNNELTIGLIGSYLFFVLTTVHNGYKININENNKNFENEYKIVQFLLNVFILITFVGIEKIMSQYLQNQPIVIESNYIKNILILGIAIIINAFLPQIKQLLNIFKKRKI